MSVKQFNSCQCSYYRSYKQSLTSLSFFKLIRFFFLSRNSKAFSLEEFPRLRSLKEQLNSRTSDCWKDWHWRVLSKMLNKTAQKTISACACFVICLCAASLCKFFTYRNSNVLKWAHSHKPAIDLAALLSC